MNLQLTNCLLPGLSFFTRSFPVIAFDLPFNPIKLFFLIVWVYLCLYIAQAIQYSPLVSKERRAQVSLAALFLGPVLFFALVANDILRKSLSTHRGILEIISEQLHSLSSTVLARGKTESTIKILDSSGRNLKEIYGHGKTSKEDSHILTLTEQVVANALNQGASDILIDPVDNISYNVRLRIDGMLMTDRTLETSHCQAVINSIKAVSGMDIAERRRPQDGAFIAKTPDGSASFRVASAGALYGEKLSVRVLNTKAGIYTLENIGLSEKQRQVVGNEIAKPAGMILMCGPAGSGKTATLYAMLENIDLFTRNVITVEDPIEYVLPNASQIEVNPKADITFAKVLRSVLRQDPNVICVGEIRDEETATIAVQAAQTGHLVIATIHSSSNASALVRLMDLGITPLMLTSGLNLLVCQRLIRRLCNHCKKPAVLTQAQIIELRKRSVNYKNIFQAAGCEHCHQTGYRGRIGIFDILLLDDKIKENIAKGQLSVTQLKKDGEQRGHSTLQKQGMFLVVSGITSLEELKRVVG